MRDKRTVDIASVVSREIVVQILAGALVNRVGYWNAIHDDGAVDVAYRILYHVVVKRLLADALVRGVLHRTLSMFNQRTVDVASEF